MRKVDGLHHFYALDAWKGESQSLRILLKEGLFVTYPKLCRRIFLAGMAAAAPLGRALAQVAPAADPAAGKGALLARFVAAHPGLVRDYRLVRLAGNARPWQDTGLTLREGEPVSLLSEGRVYPSRAPNLWLLPRVVLWARIGEADVFRPGTDTYSFRSAHAGSLRLATLQGSWSTPGGDHAAPAVYDSMEGAIDVLIIRWAGDDAAQGMAALAAFAPGEQLFEAEQRRLQTPSVLPRGFAPLWYVGSGDNFAEVQQDGAPIIALRSELNGGIICAPLDLSLERGLTVAWEWRVNQLPSVRAEDLTPFHQYASLAIGFDDGQDLSWYWSASMEADAHYRCPFPSFPGETHLVVRSGSADQGRWIGERRDVHVDVGRALSRAPARVTGVWLIASTMFGERPASVDFRNIAVIDARGARHPIFPT